MTDEDVSLITEFQSHYDNQTKVNYKIYLEANRLITDRYLLTSLSKINTHFVVVLLLNNHESLSTYHLNIHLTPILISPFNIQML